MNDSLLIWIVIFSAATVTYCLRLGGLLLANKLPKHGFVRRFMDAIPPAILLALVAPGIAQAGAIGLIAAAVVTLITLKTRNVMLAMVVGVVIVALERQDILFNF